jgi:hypothetical protein
MTLKDKAPFISGGSRGIGLEIGLRAERDGANVAPKPLGSEPRPMDVEDHPGSDRVSTRPHDFPLVMGISAAGFGSGGEGRGPRMGQIALLFSLQTDAQPFLSYRSQAWVSRGTDLVAPSLVGCRVRALSAKGLTSPGNQRGRRQ